MDANSFLDMTEIKGCPYGRDSPEGVLWLNRARAYRDMADHKKKAEAAMVMSDKHMELYRKAEREVKAFDAALAAVMSAKPHSVNTKAKKRA